MKSPERSFFSRALFGCTGSDLPPEVVLLVRLVAMTWLLSGHVLLIPTRSVPFFESLAPLADSPIVGWVALVLGAVSAVQLVLGKSVRVSALTLGSVIFLTTLLSRAFFSNNRLYVGCVLVLSALAASKGPPRLLRAQVVVLYVAAGLDKLLDADWRSGVFLRSFSGRLASYGHLFSPGEHASPGYLPSQAVGSLFDAYPGLAVVASWGTLLLEIGIGVTLLVGWRRAGIALGLAFHAGLLVYTGSPLGMFFYAATASYFAFVTLPSRIDVRAGPRLHALLFRALHAVDADGRCHLEPGPKLNVTIDGATRTGFDAFFGLVARLPAFYVVVAAVLAGPWFTPFSVLVLLPLVLGFCSFAPLAQPPKVRQVTG